VVNDVEALHHFTNLSRPVDFAGRMVFNEQGEEVFNFGKHKGRSVEAVFAMEPSYYSWMMQGDFPLYTKQCLEKVWKRFRMKQKGTANVPRDTDPSKRNSQAAGRQPQEGRPKRKSGPITDDMLKDLQAKFSK